METPCINVCVIDERNRHCVGCWRSIDEISRWARMSAEERRQVMDDLPERRRRLVVRRR